MKPQEKGKLLRGMLSTPNASDTNLNLLLTPYHRTVSESSTSRRNRQTLRATSPVLYNSSKMDFLEGLGIRKQGQAKFQCSKILLSQTLIRLQYRRKWTQLHNNYTPNNDLGNVRMNILLHPVANTQGLT
jgi:hypothetical protein